MTSDYRSVTWATKPDVHLSLGPLDIHPDKRSIHMSINEIEKLISSNLGLLGFTPTDRSRLGVAEVRATSKIEELIARREALHAK